MKQIQTNTIFYGNIYFYISRCISSLSIDNRYNFVFLKFSICIFYYILIICFFPGLLQIIGAGIFVSDSEGGSVSWSFGLAIVAGVILLISGAVYAFIARKHGYTLKPQIPCRGENA